MAGNTRILDESRQRYAQLHTYRDEGFIEAVYDCQGMGESRSTFRFKTWFRKPKSFRYELSRDDALLETIIFDGRQAWSRKPNSKPQRCDSLWVAAGSLFAGGEIDPYILNALIPIDMIRFLILGDKAEYIEKCWLQDEEQHHIKVTSSTGDTADFFISVEFQKIRRISRLRYHGSTPATPAGATNQPMVGTSSDPANESYDHIVRTYLIVEWDCEIPDAVFES